MGGILTVALICSPANASNFDLKDGASTAVINAVGVGGGTGPSSGAAGNNSIRRNDPTANTGGLPTRGHLEDMEQQWYWIGVDGGAPSSIDNVGGGALSEYDDVDGDGDNDRLRFTYEDSDTIIRVQYKLIGSEYPNPNNPNSGYAATMLRTVEIINLSGIQHEYNLFSLSDLALTEFVGIGHDPLIDEKVELEASPAGGLDERIRQSDSAAIVGEISSATTSFLALNTPVKYRIVDDNSLIAFIEADNDLDDSGNPTDPAGSQTGEDMQFATQWDFKLDPFESFVVNESLIIVPEPGTMSLFGLLATFAALRPRRR
ncbi:MAG: hypothetical protein CMJ18_03675 [Phycisphaeraceae bacterium]|nr:hypothetical protein [Phycisphaeraceae bacterium]